MAKRKAKQSSTTCLITGFDTFDGQYNPSELVVELLPPSINLSQSSDAPLRSAVLPTCCNQSWTVLQRAMQKYSPAVLIMCGMAKSRKTVCIERFALNVQDYRIADNAGHQWDGNSIDPDGPEALRTGVQLGQLKSHLTRRGFPCEISNHAGTFVCNDVYYRALRQQQKSGAPALVLFVHLPMPSVYARTALAQSKRQRDLRLSRSRKLQLQLLTQAVLEIAKFCTHGV